MKRIAFAVAALLLSGCNRIPDEAVIAVLKPIPERIAINRCLKVEGKDPSPQLLAAVNARGSHFLPFSACKRGKYGYKTVTGQDASVVHIFNFKRTSPSRATVEQSEATGMLGGSGWKIQLERRNGKWVVVSEVMGWISVWPNNSFKPSPLRGLGPTGAASGGPA